MERITLTLAPRHLHPLRHVCKANYERLMDEPDATPEDREIAADLYRRVMLLDNAVNAEKIATITRKKYTSYINGKPATAHRNGAQPPAQGEAGNDAPTEEKPQEGPPEPPQVTEAATSSADVVKRTM